MIISYSVPVICMFVFFRSGNPVWWEGVETVVEGCRLGYRLGASDLFELLRLDCFWGVLMGLPVHHVCRSHYSRRFLRGFGSSAWASS